MALLQERVNSFCCAPRSLSSGKQLTHCSAPHQGNNTRTSTAVMRKGDRWSKGVLQVAGLAFHAPILKQKPEGKLAAVALWGAVVCKVTELGWQVFPRPVTHSIIHQGKRIDN